MPFFISSAGQDDGKLGAPLRPLSALPPTRTYLGGEISGHVWMAAFGTFPTGLGRTRKVYRGIFASTSILGTVRTVHVDLGRSSDV